MRPEDAQLLEELYRAHFHALVVHAYRYLDDWNEATLAAQEAFHIACEKIDVLRASANPIGWLKETTRNVCRNLWKTRQRQLQLLVSLDDLPENEQPARALEAEADYADTFTSVLSPEEYRLLKRIVLDGDTYLELAQELGISMWACRKRVQRATEKLRKRYDRSKE